jgi:hypothetical protein
MGFRRADCTAQTFGRLRSVDVGMEDDDWNPPLTKLEDLVHGVDGKAYIVVARVHGVSYGDRIVVWGNEPWVELRVRRTNLLRMWWGGGEPCYFDVLQHPRRGDDEKEAEIRRWHQALVAIARHVPVARWGMSREEVASVWTALRERWEWGNMKPWPTSRTEPLLEGLLGPGRKRFVEFCERWAPAVGASRYMWEQVGRCAIEDDSWSAAEHQGTLDAFLAQHPEAQVGLSVYVAPILDQIRSLRLGHQPTQLLQRVTRSAALAELADESLAASTRKALLGPFGGR